MKKPFRTIGIFAVATAASLSLSHGQTVINATSGGIVDSRDPNTVWLTNITDTDGNQKYGGAAMSYCFEHGVTGLAGSFTAYDTLSSSFANNDDPFMAYPMYPWHLDRASGMVEWLFDNYYDVYGLGNPNVTQAEALAFHDVLWEIQKDYNVTPGTLNASAGNLQIYGMPKANEMIAAINAFSPGYTAFGTYHSSKFKFAYLDAGNQQNQLLVMPVATPVPEPTALMIASSAGLVLLLRRRKA